VQAVDAGDQVEVPVGPPAVDWRAHQLKAGQRRARGEVVDEVDAGNRRPADEAITAQRVRGLDERPPAAAAQVQPGGGAVGPGPGAQQVKRAEAQLALVAIDPSQLSVPVHRVVGDHR